MVCMRMGLYTMMAMAALMTGGCGSNATKGPESPKSATPAADSSAVAVNWCVEHGMPEDICAQCNAKVAADFKQKGDWCKEHDLPESQCTLCHPELKEKFEAMRPMKKQGG